MNDPGGYQSYAFIAELYDQVIPYRERTDVAFYVETAKQYGGAVLEVGCGTGRVLVPTAQAGIPIVGMDLSQSMLDVCRDRLAAEPQAVQARARLVEADMRDFSLGETFRLATIPFRPFQHLISVEEQLACLAAIRRHLEPGGTLVFDVFNPMLESLTRDNLGVEMGEEPDFTTPDGLKVVRWYRTLARDFHRQIIHVELIYYATHPDGREERLVHAFPMRYFFRYEVEHLLVRSGFEVVDVYADFDRTPFGSIYPGELIFTARKTDD
ncbi:MAG: class I SAM-dependent methyltransferase [Anaerolineae bacterium]|nr:class I SAM-dependent methyltransferase [Anaerolineae bacterium]